MTPYEKMAVYVTIDRSQILERHVPAHKTTQTEPSRTGALPSQPRLTRGRRVAIIGSLAFAAFVMILNETVLTVSLPALMHEFNITAATGDWLTTAFMLTMAVVIPTTGRLLSRFSPRNIFLVAIGFFLVGSLLAALARTSRSCCSPASCRRAARRSSCRA